MLILLKLDLDTKAAIVSECIDDAKYNALHAVRPIFLLLTL